jgi:O-succinylbenzoic acid--CoA ligase
VAVIDSRDAAALAPTLDELLSARGVERSTPLAFRARADVPSVTFALALLAAGRPLVPLHSRWTAKETTDALRLVDGVEVVDDLDDLVKIAARRPRASPSEPRADDLAAIVFTSGASGRPKPVLLERKSFLASAHASATNLGWRDDDAWLLSLPFAHVGGLSVLTRSLFAQKRVVVSASDPEAMLASGASILSLVPAQLFRLLEVDRENRLARARVVLVGGAELPLALRREASARGVTALASYGSTETCSQIVAQSPSDNRDPGSLDSGRALRNVELRIQDGQIQVRGPMLMRGYAGEVSRAAEDFFATGDLGRLDETGRLFVEGRADDTIVTGGENVQPLEIERAALSHPGVRSALCFGVPDSRWGEVIALALVLAPGFEEARELEAAFADLAPFKRPRHFVTVRELPVLGSGKPDRKRAKRELAGSTRT